MAPDPRRDYQSLSFISDATQKSKNTSVVTAGTCLRECPLPLVQKTLATAGRVHLSAPGKQPGRRPTARRRRDNSRPWVLRFIGRRRRRRHRRRGGGGGAQPKANKWQRAIRRTTTPTIGGHADDPAALRRLRQLLTFRPHFKAIESDKRENTAVVCPTEDGTDEEVVERWDMEIREEGQRRGNCAQNMEEAGSVGPMVPSRGGHECSDSGDGVVAAAGAAPNDARDDDDDDDDDSYGFSVDVGVVDDVTCDEGFELGEVRHESKWMG